MNIVQLEVIMNKVVTSKEEILQTSRKLIQKKGWAAVSIRSVASACNVSTGSIYNYFDSKTDLVGATIEKPAPKLIEKPTSNSKIEAVAPTAANEFSPRTCPTIAVSTALYNCWKQFEIKIGIMNIIRFFKIGPCNKSTDPFTLSLRIFYPSILYNYNLWSNLKQCSLNTFSICIK